MKAMRRSLAASSIADPTRRRHRDQLDGMNQAGIGPRHKASATDKSALGALVLQGWGDPACSALNGVRPVYLHRGTIFR